MNDSSLKHYLSNLYTRPLLKREEEVDLLRKIEEKQVKILRDSIASDFFCAELLEILVGREIEDSEELVKISKKLNLESTKKEISTVKKALKSLIKKLKAKNPNFIRDLKSVSLSGTLVHSLVTRIKKQYSKVATFEKKFHNLDKFLSRAWGVSNTQLSKLVHQNPRHLQVLISQSVSLSPIEKRRHLESIECLHKLTDTGLDTTKFKEIKALYHSIVDSEEELEVYRNELVQRNLRLVVARAKKFMNRGLDLEDLIQEGNLGLIKAINKHDASRGTKVGTYATWWIDQTIRRAIDNKANTVRIPPHIGFFRLKLSAATNKLTAELGRTPTKPEIAEKLGVEVSVLEKLENTALYELSIDEELPSGLSITELLPSETSKNPLNLTSSKLTREKVRKVLSKLSPQSEKILRLRFGIGEANDGWTLKKISEKTGLSRAKIKEIQHKALQKLMKNRELKDEL